MGLVYYEINEEYKATKVACVPVTYVDTITLFLRWPISSKDWRQLTPHFGSIVPDKDMQGLHRGFPYVVAFHQPRPVGIIMLDSVIAEHFVYRVDVALDFVTGSDSDSKLIANDFNRRFCQKWRGQRHRGSCGGTQYLGPKGTNRNIAIYSDRPTKTGDDPCCHLEARFKRKATCATRGVSRLIDLLDLDLVGIWRKELRLMQIDQAKLERQLAAWWRKKPKLRRPRRQLRSARLFPEWSTRRYRKSRAIGLKRRRLIGLATLGTSQDFFDEPAARQFTKALVVTSNQEKVLNGLEKTWAWT